MGQNQRNTGSELVWRASAKTHRKTANYWGICTKIYQFTSQHTKYTSDFLISHVHYHACNQNLHWPLRNSIPLNANTGAHYWDVPAQGQEPEQWNSAYTSCGVSRDSKGFYPRKTVRAWQRNEGLRARTPEAQNCDMAATNNAGNAVWSRATAEQLLLQFLARHN